MKNSTGQNIVDSLRMIACKIESYNFSSDTQKGRAMHFRLAANYLEDWLNELELRSISYESARERVDKTIIELEKLLDSTSTW